MINRRAILGMPLARRRNRRLLVITYWTAVLMLAGLASLSLKWNGASFEPLAFPDYEWEPN
jgi:hypothetical protein